MGRSPEVSSAVNRSLRRLTELLDPERVTGEPDLSAGYVNLLGRENRSPGLGQNIMQSRLYPLIYKPWRAFGARVLLGQSVAQERAMARRLLDLKSGDLVLDVACGPGNFTGWYGETVGPDGFAVGLDLSHTMLAQAVAGTSEKNVAYLRADALDLPFADGTFDAACCFLAIFLMPDPMKAVNELMRVVRPGGHVAIMAPTRSGNQLWDTIWASAMEITGRFSATTIVRREDLINALTDNGLELGEVRTIAQATYVGGRKPTA